MKNLAVLFALLLGGCQSVTTAYDIATGLTVTPQSAYVAANAFDVAEGTATNYLRLPVCPTGKPVCRTASVTHKLIAYIRAGRIARNQIEAAVNQSGGAPVSASLYNVLVSSTTSIQQIIATVQASQ